MCVRARARARARVCVCVFLYQYCRYHHCYCFSANIGAIRGVGGLISGSAPTPSPISIWMGLLKLEGLGFGNHFLQSFEHQKRLK